jgi:hypothetical protein
MLRAALVIMAALFAAPVLAEDTDPALQWRDCSVDADCIAVQGTCNLTAVNVDYKDNAVEYYRKLHADSNCVKRFWEPTKNVVPECKPLAGSKADKNTTVMVHGTCAMVPKPSK